MNKNEKIQFGFCHVHCDDTWSTDDRTIYSLTITNLRTHESCEINLIEIDCLPSVVYAETYQKIPGADRYYLTDTRNLRPDTVSPQMLAVINGLVAMKAF